MIRIYYYKPAYKDKWFGPVHVYRYGFVEGMKGIRRTPESINPALDKNFIAGYWHGHEYHNQWKLKQLLKGKQT